MKFWLKREKLSTIEREGGRDGENFIHREDYKILTVNFFFSLNKNVHELPIDPVV